MDERVLTRGLVCAVWFNSANTEVHVGSWFIVSDAEADKALAAKRAGKEIEIVQPEGGFWKDRTVRLVPVVVVKWRGGLTSVAVNGVTSIYKDKGNSVTHTTVVSNWRDAALAMHDRAEVEIVSIDGGPDTVRRVS